MRRGSAFRWHVAVFAIGNLGIALLWVADAGFPLGWAPSRYWPAWIHATWGIGLALHARDARQAR